MSGDAITSSHAWPREKFTVRCNAGERIYRTKMYLQIVHLITIVYILGPHSN